MTLEDTIGLMCSDDYEDRFVAEYHQLRIRHERLSQIIDSLAEGKADFTPTCTTDILFAQALAMEQLLKIYKFRADVEDIELEV